MAADAAGFRVLQLSDCHLSADPATPYRGRNADAQLAALLPAAAAWAPDLVLLSGDLSEDGSAASYARLARHLAVLRVPCCSLPGNHDDAVVMRTHFPVGPWAGMLALDAGSWRLVLLDSTAPGRVEGALPGERLAALETELTRAAGRPTLLALHHQPVPVGSPWIDRYMLTAPERLLALIARWPEVRLVSWGHVHQAFAAERGGALLLAAPSTAVNSLPGCDRFTEDPAGPAGRWIVLRALGAFETGLLRAAARP